MSLITCKLNQLFRCPQSSYSSNVMKISSKLFELVYYRQINVQTCVKTLRLAVQLGTA